MKSTSATKRARFIDVHNYDHTTGREVPKGISQTVPGQGVNLRDLLERYVRTGTTTDPSMMRRAMYGSEDADYDDDDLEKFSSDDIVDQHQLMAERGERAEAFTRQEAEAKQATHAEQVRSKASGKQPPSKPPLPPSPGIPGTPQPNEEAPE